MKTIPQLACLLASMALVSNSRANFVGPVYPPPLGVGFSESGVAGDGNIARAGGKSFYYGNTILANYEAVFWGVPDASRPRMSFQSPSYSGAEIMVFRSDLSTASQLISAPE